ncbi:MAG TPA: M13 family metallopeptidase [Thermoanaerobaculia bacterium]
MRRTLATLLALLAPGALAAAEIAAGRDLTPEHIESSVLGSMDRSADPCVDFYRYACGGWLDTTPLPADQSRWTRSFSTITERNREIVRTLLEDAAANPGGSEERRKVGDFYAACMDEEAVERAGIAPLAPWFAEVDAVADAKALFAVTAKLQRAGAGPLFGFGPLPDLKTPDVNVAFIAQGGLALPDRDYYVSEDPKKQEILAAYGQHVARMFELAGVPTADAAADATQVVAFETELAKTSRTRTEMRNIEKLYNRLEREGLHKLAPNLPWQAFYDGTPVPGAQELIVATPEFFETLGKLVETTSYDTLRTYLEWHLLTAAADYLSRPFVDENFAFYGKTLSGQQEIQPRWKRCVAATTGALGEAIGKVYVEQEFAGASKQVAVEMIRDIESAFEANLPQLAWMDDATRERARGKIAKISNKIGYPDSWRDYSALAVSRASYFDNALAGATFETDRQLRKIGQPVDKSEWLMVPQLVNAYYNPLQNEIAFPAGILQPPFFHKDYPAALNYGGIGAVVGHEVTHGFDDQGRRFDPNGVFQEWWEPEVAGKFETAAKCVADQYSTFEIEPGVKVNGELTLGENIADLGGLKQAYKAYKAWEGRHGEPEPLAEGLTNDQLVFVAWGQVWCTVAAPEYVRRQVTTDPHSPGIFRATAPPMNSPEFRQAFGCEAGQPMAPAEMCTVW